MRDGYPGWDGQGAVKVVQLGTAPALVQVCEANERRITLILGSPPAGIVYYTTNPSQPAVAGAQGLVVGVGSGAHAMERATHGGLVTRAWFAVGSVADTAVGIAEAYE